MTNANIIDTLNDLIEISKDGEYGFNQCAKYAISTELKNIFRIRGTECHVAAHELMRLANVHGGNPDEEGNRGCITPWLGKHAGRDFGQ
ncbi:DUF2383 domain-containing protein [Chitinimonas sp. BJB300]|uniref:DUF2383 domain-containing protein n=1 Tax=Chitinimonas sp. BJB300 TaxID=1559339 RepID=UPI0021012C78|nr:DUF2383 domain-containing protein [Chitinimonas sp. BJB300]